MAVYSEPDTVVSTLYVTVNSVGGMPRTALVALHTQHPAAICFDYEPLKAGQLSKQNKTKYKKKTKNNKKLLSIEHRPRSLGVYALPPPDSKANCANTDRHRDTQKPTPHLK